MAFPSTSQDQQGQAGASTSNGAMPAAQPAPSQATTPPHKQANQPSSKDKKQNPDAQNPDDKEREKAAVRQWTSKIKTAKKKQKDVFQEMRDSMKFSSGLQWPGQKSRNDARYIANWVLREANTKVAQLYAKNPTAVFERRKRLDFALYDGHLESLIPILQAASGHPAGLMGLPPQAQALIADYQHGMQQRALVDRVGRTLEVLFQYNLDEQDEEEGDFKLQFKQLVRQAIIAKVGYIRVSFIRDTDILVTSTGIGNTVTNRAMQIKHISDDVDEGKIKRSDKEIETLQNLAIGLGGTMKDKQNLFGTNERLVYDCLPATSVIIDPKTRALKGFIGGDWVVIEYNLRVCDANAIFDADIKNSATQNAHFRMEEKQNINAQKVEKGEEQCVIWEVLNKKDRTHFYICDGYETYLAEPEYLTPAVSGFWPLYALTFNDIVCDPSIGQTPFPPSDVELLMHAQREFNRSRNELKKHRKANAPGWLGGKGVLSEDDKKNLEDMESNAYVELENIPQGMKPSDMFSPKPMVPIQPQVYDNSPQLQDANLTTGGMSQPMNSLKNTTATGDQLQEQKEMTVTTSNVDDVDDCLTWLARVSGQMALQGYSVATIQRICGPGAAWPQLQADKLNMLSSVSLTIKAASSGRPNKALDIRNWQMSAPVLQQAGANPQFMVRHTLHVLDSNIDPEEAFPLVPTAQPRQGQVSPSGGEHQPSQQQAHQPGVTPPNQQSRPGPGAGPSAGVQQHPQHQPPAHPASVQANPPRM